MSANDIQADTTTFSDLGLPATLLQALTEVGYETPSPIQAAAILRSFMIADAIAQPTA